MNEVPYFSPAELASFVRVASDMDPSLFYCEHGHQWHDCAECGDMETYRGSDPSLYREQEKRS
jgi:hypothetical protein